jgi:hypothetical protein
VVAGGASKRGNTVMETTRFFPVVKSSFLSSSVRGTALPEETVSSLLPLSSFIDPSCQYFCLGSTLFINKDRNYNKYLLGLPYAPN